MAPMEFQALVEDQLPDVLKGSIGELLERKRAGDELDEGPALPEVNAFLQQKMTYFKESLGKMPKAPRPDWSILDVVFRDCLAEAWGAR